MFIFASLAALEMTSVTRMHTLRKPDVLGGGGGGCSDAQLKES